MKGTNKNVRKASNCMEILQPVCLQPGPHTPVVNAAADGGSSSRTASITLTATPGEASPRGQVASDCTVICQAVVGKGDRQNHPPKATHLRGPERHVLGAHGLHGSSWEPIGAPRADRKGQSPPTSLDAYVVTNHHHHTWDPRQREHVLGGGN